MPNDNENVIEIELTPDREAIRGGKAHFLLTKVWGGVDFSHRGSLGKQGFTMIPDGKFRVVFPFEGEEFDLEDLRNVFKGMMESFEGSWDVFVRLGEGDF